MDVIIIVKLRLIVDKAKIRKLCVAGRIFRHVITEIFFKESSFDDTSTVQSW